MNVGLCWKGGQEVVILAVISTSDVESIVWSGVSTSEGSLVEELGGSHCWCGYHDYPPGN